MLRFGGKPGPRAPLTPGTKTVPSAGPRRGRPLCPLGVAPSAVCSVLTVHRGSTPRSSWIGRPGDANRARRGPGTSHRTEGSAGRPRLHLPPRRNADPGPALLAELGHKRGGGGGGKQGGGRGRGRGRGRASPRTPPAARPAPPAASCRAPPSPTALRPAGPAPPVRGVRPRGVPGPGGCSRLPVPPPPRPPRPRPPPSGRPSATWRRTGARSRPHACFA